MTILENAILETIATIEKEKRQANREPTHVLETKDHLLQRVNHTCPVDITTLRATLRELAIYGHIEMGETINDKYIRTKQQYNNEIHES